MLCGVQVVFNKCDVNKWKSVVCAYVCKFMKTSSEMAVHWRSLQFSNGSRRRCRAYTPYIYIYIYICTYIYTERETEREREREMTI